MCLITKQKKPLIAEKNITVCKHLFKTATGKLKSPFHTFFWDFNILYKCELSQELVDNEKIVDSRFYPNKTELVLKKELTAIRSAFHTTINPDYYIMNTGTRFNEKLPSSKMFYAVIPKGSLYFLNDFGSIASNKLIIIQEYYFFNYANDFPCVTLT